MKTLKSEITTLRIKGMHLPARREKKISKEKLGERYKQKKTLFSSAESVNIQTAEMVHKKSSSQFKKCGF